MTIKDELLDELLTDYENPEGLLGKVLTTGSFSCMPGA
jgi:hypothetical protein